MNSDWLVVVTLTIAGVVLILWAPSLLIRYNAWDHAPSRAKFGFQSAPATRVARAQYTDHDPDHVPSVSIRGNCPDLASVTDARLNPESSWSLTDGAICADTICADHSSTRG